MEFFEEIRLKLKKNNEAYFNVKVRPNSNVSQIKEVTAEGVVRLDLKAKPIHGQANEELVKFLAKELGVSKNNIKILSGRSGKEKLVKILV
jgi:hypothetical protein